MRYILLLSFYIAFLASNAQDTLTVMQSDSSKTIFIEEGETITIISCCSDSSDYFKTTQTVVGYFEKESADSVWINAEFVYIEKSEAVDDSSSSLVTYQEITNRSYDDNNHFLHGFAKKKSGSCRRLLFFISGYQCQAPLFGICQPTL